MQEYSNEEGRKWPEIFGYLQKARKILDAPYVDSQNKEQLYLALDLDRKAFNKFLEYDGFIQNRFQMSSTGSVYRLKFPTNVFVALLVLFFIVFFVSGYLANTLREASKEALLGLTASYLIYVIWLPMRAVMIKAKFSLYTDPTTMGELLLGVLFLTAGVALAVAWWEKFSDRLLSLTTIGSGLIVGMIPLLYPDALVQGLQEARFYVGMAFLYLVPIAAVLSYKGFIQLREQEDGAPEDG